MASIAKQHHPAPEDRSRKAGKRPYLKQSDVPEFSLNEALRIPLVISQQFGGHPAAPVDVAMALNLLPQGRHFKQLSGAAVAYGLVTGGSQAGEISLDDLGRRSTTPIEEGDDIVARREAFLRPRVIREFLNRYSGSSLPTDERIARNVLESMGVPRDRTTDAFQMIVAEAQNLGLIAAVKDRQVVNLRPTNLRILTTTEPNEDYELAEDEPVLSDSDLPAPLPQVVERISDLESAPSTPNRRVFISHGGNKRIVAQLKELLSFGDFEPVVSEEKETTARPVPKKVLDDMRSCVAGIIHVGTDRTIVDNDGTQHHLLNENVLTEIGAAMALWGENYILLVEEGTKLPSNLQGLYEARYEGDALDHDATMKLLRTFKEFKS